MAIEALLVFLIIGAIAGWLAGQVMKGGSMGLVGNIDQFLDRINNPALQNVITEIEWFQLDSEVTYQEIQDLVHIIRDKSSLQDQLTKKQAEMKEARKKNDNERLKTIMLEIVSLSKELKATKK